ncbi:family 16 glycosylhydrolase [Mycobacterium sp. 3519A]|uniref:glycoside hydrolase family 16 protein n=1 Tax=Mycobacterium sp. 3519A TaxID=2057184 RepID=UPI001F2DC419|nr:glycoside hydrolase family 16 protein [Mycobacterium sp. 3519A]
MIGALVAAVLALNGGALPASSAQDGWYTTFADEFDGTTGSPAITSVWLPDVGEPGRAHSELQYYTARGNTYLDGEGHLVIEAREGSDGHTCWYGKCRYTSGRLTTHNGQRTTFSQRYGKFEARIKSPVGRGTWPAFWLVGDDFDRAPWPTPGEIDVMEALGQQANIVQQSAHGPQLTFTQPYTLPDGQSVADWHTYSIEWTADLIEWQVDGNTTRSLARNEAREGWVFDHPFFILLNLAIGGDWAGDPDATTIFPARMLIDYVRVYQNGNS